LKHFGIGGQLPEDNFMEEILVKMEAGAEQPFPTCQFLCLEI
jgi:hypothetical protein